jgi:hypothetical protein
MRVGPPRRRLRAISAGRLRLWRSRCSLCWWGSSSSGSSSARPEAPLEIRAVPRTNDARGWPQSARSGAVPAELGRRLVWLRDRREVRRLRHRSDRNQPVSRRRRRPSGARHVCRTAAEHLSSRAGADQRSGRRRHRVSPQRHGALRIKALAVRPRQTAGSPPENSGGSLGVVSGCERPLIRRPSIPALFVAR